MRMHSSIQRTDADENYTNIKVFSWLPKYYEGWQHSISELDELINY